MWQSGSWVEQFKVESSAKNSDYGFGVLVLVIQGLTVPAVGGRVVDYVLVISYKFNASNEFCQQARMHIRTHNQHLCQIHWVAAPIVLSASLVLSSLEFCHAENQFLPSLSGPHVTVVAFPARFGTCRML